MLAAILVLVSLAGCSPNLIDSPSTDDEKPTEISATSIENKLPENQISDKIARAVPAKISATTHRAAFGSVPALSTIEISPALVDSATTVVTTENFSEVAEFLEVEFSDSQKKFLDENKFLLVPISETKFGSFDKYDSFDKMLSVFDAIGGSSSEYSRKPQNVRLVTPDIVLHGFHKFFENSLEYLEQNELSEILRRFTADIRQQLVVRKNSASGELAERYENLAAQFTVAQVLLENANWLDEEADAIDTFENAEKMLGGFEADFSSSIFQKIKNELELIYAAELTVTSPLFNQYKTDKSADFTQYTPRSHYSKNSRLRAYFRTMMYFGRNSYFFEEDVGITDSILLADLFSNSDSSLADWQKIMAITGFYAGESDDIGYPEWHDFLISVLGEGKLNPAVALDSTILAEIRGRLDELRSPKILSDVIVNLNVFEKTKKDLLDDTKAFRVFGQRFTFDAWALNRLTGGDEDPNLSSTPSALFVPAAFGDTTAENFAIEFLKREFNFDESKIKYFSGELVKLKSDFTKITDNEWFGSLGTAWTHVLGTLTQKFGAGYPLYMQSKFFPAKQIQTFLGSYSELKHDTLLYAKQSYAELGGGVGEGEPPPVPKGFVEPNLEFWYEMQRLVDYTISGFKQHELFPRALGEWGTLGRFKKQIDFYTEFAGKELRGEQILEDDYEKLRTFDLDYLARPFDDSPVLDEDDRRVALIADIHTDALRGQILYEAIGQPLVQLVLIGNENSPRLAIGLAFNHFEFTAPLGGNRLTDESWQSRIYENPSELPAKNFWYENLLAE